MRGVIPFQVMFSRYSRVGLFPRSVQFSKVWSTSSACSCRTSSSFSNCPPNSSITPTLVSNRNPRNLEKLRIGEKPIGWDLEKPGRSFWNKITLEVTSKHISASVVHYLGQRPINVSTKEWCIKKFLYNTNDASAAKLVGQVLAQRCLYAGITEVSCFFPESERLKEKVKLFLSALEEGGISLNELDQVLPDHDIHSEATNPERPWEIHEDVDDRFSVASKLQDYKERKELNPSATDAKKYFKNLEIAKQSKLLVDREE